MGAQELLTLDFVCPRLKEQWLFFFFLSESCQNFDLFRAQHANWKIQYMMNTTNGAIMITGKSEAWPIISCLKTILVLLLLFDFLQFLSSCKTFCANWLPMCFAIWKRFVSTDKATNEYLFHTFNYSQVDLTSLQHWDVTSRHLTVKQQYWYWLWNFQKYQYHRNTGMWLYVRYSTIEHPNCRGPFTNTPVSSPLERHRHPFLQNYYLLGETIFSDNVFTLQHHVLNLCN